MIRAYIFRRRLSDEIVTLAHLGPRDRIKQDLFTRVKMRGNDRKCAVTGAPIARGSMAWAPITNGNNRMDRICDAGILQLEGKAAAK